MALPSTGELSFSAIRTELGQSGAIDLNNSSVRGLAGKASGVISFSDLRGKTNTATITEAVDVNLSYKTNFIGDKTYLIPAGSNPIYKSLKNVLSCTFVITFAYSVLYQTGTAKSNSNGTFIMNLKKTFDNTLLSSSLSWDYTHWLSGQSLVVTFNSSTPIDLYLSSLCLYRCDAGSTYGPRALSASVTYTYVP